MSGEPGERPVFAGGLLVFLLFVVAFFLLQRLTFHLRFPPFDRTTIWTPGALTFAALLLTPAKRWWIFYAGICLGGYAAYLGDQAIPAWIALVAAQFHFFTVMMGVWAIRRYSRAPLFDNPTALLCFVVVAGVIVPVATSLPIELLRWVRGAADVWPVAIRSVLCVALGLLIATPAVALLIANSRAWVKAMTWARLVELALIAAILLGVGHFVFGRPAGDMLPAMLYLPIPLLLWAALRFGLAGVCWTLLALAYQSTWGAIHGNGPFVGSESAANVLHLQLYLLMSSLPLMFLAVVIEQRSQAYKELARQAEQVRSQFAQLSTIYQTAPVGLGFMDADLRVVSMNDRLAEMSGLLAGVHVGKTMHGLLPALAGTAETDFRRAIEAGQPIIASEVHGATSAQPDVGRDWLVSHYPVKDSQGQLLGVSTVVEEISERKRADRLRRELVHASRLALLGEFTASIAHEINQPLGAILSNVDAAEMILEASPSNLHEVRQILMDIRRDDLRASEVIRRLRNLLRNDEVEFQLLDINETILEAIALIGPDARRREILLCTRLAEELPQVSGDRIHLQQILLNLAVNAMESVDDSKSVRRIDIGTEQRDQEIVVSVSDTGSGIPPERLSSVFNHFFSTKQEGMGLGLAITRMLVERHGGRIWVNNTSGSGATFQFCIPIAAAAQAAEHPSLQGTV